MIAILILNWNGWQDTIDCLRSLHKATYKDYFIVVGDNGSTNDSKKQIVKFCNNEHISIKQEALNEEKIDAIEKGEVILYDLLTNNGFAKGNNLMVKYSKKFCPEFYFVLNNDTEVAPDYMNVLMNFKTSYPTYEVLTPLIPYYYEKEKVWCAGGKVFWGFRKYFYADKLCKSIRESEFIDCSFVTGCAMLFSNNCLKADGNLYSEAFFFGEDDFELALRFKREKVKQACVLKSVVYHKVSSSTSSAPSLSKIYIHYLNRYINLRLNLNCFSFHCWRLLNNAYLFRLLKRKNFSTKEVRNFLKRLNKDCFKYEGVSKEFFENTLGIVSKDKLN